MMSGKDKDKKFADTQDAEAGAMLAERGGGGGDTGIATQRLADFRGKSGDADMDIGPRMPRRRAAVTAPAATSPLMTDTGDETERLARRYPSPVPRESLSDRSAAKAEGSFLDRQAYKRATQAEQAEDRRKAMGMKKGGVVSSASKRADGIAVKGKTKGRMV
jgi:hypothetical protein